MKALDNLKIGTLLRIGLGTILAFVLALGALAWSQSELLWENTQDLYEHPLQVRRAVGELKADVLAMSRAMKDLGLGENEAQRLASLQLIDTYEADAKRQLDVLFERYLGPRSDVEVASRSFEQWKAPRADIIRLLREGNAAEVAVRTRPGGVSNTHVEVLLGHVQKISDFAIAKGDELYRSAAQRNRDLNRQLGYSVAVIFLLSLVVSSLLLKRIKEPLLQLTVASEQFRRGKLDARCEYSSASELGTLAAGFNALAETTQVELTFRQRVADLNAVMLRELESGEFRRCVLEALMRVTGSQVGAIYLLDEHQAAYQHLESIGLGGAARASFSATQREGELGAALASGKLQHIAEIPADTRFAFAAVSGDFRPRELLTVPLFSATATAAIISLGSVRGYNPTALRLVEELQNPLTTWMNSMLANQQLKLATARLTQQNRELDAQTSELVMQASELSQQSAELEQQKRQLEQSNRLKSTFLSYMSHELRTPLNSVIALRGVLGRRLIKTIPEEEHGYLGVIERNGKHLLTLINDILDLSHIEAGKAEITVERFSLKQLAAELVAMLEPQVRDSQVTLASTIGDDLPLVTSDRTKCRHILQNLLGNAVKFTEAGRVEISAISTEDVLRIAVTDTGIGIAADRLGLIFDEFRQADESTARMYGGTGLGLAIANKYASLLQGSIEVASSPGEGSTFTLTLPLALGTPVPLLPAEPERTPAPAEVQAAPPSGHGKGKRLLLIDDNEPAIVQMTDILAEQGYELRAARGGREALAQLEVWLPDAVLLDLMMPGIDGFEVLRAMREVDRTAQVPVLILTAKRVTKEELRFLKGNHIYQLVQKGDVGRAQLLVSVAAMIAPPLAKNESTEPTPLGPALRRPRSGPPSRPGKPLVLVAEDNLDNLLTVRALLQDNYQVIEAENGRNAVSQALAHLPDLVLMDIAMPVMDGIQALRAMRAEERLWDIPVIALTASAMKGNREEILAHGFDGYIAKPIDTLVFFKIIQGVLDTDA